MSMGIPGPLLKQADITKVVSNNSFHNLIYVDSTIILLLVSDMMKWFVGR